MSVNTSPRIEVQSLDLQALSKNYPDETWER